MAPTAMAVADGPLAVIPAPTASAKAAADAPVTDVATAPQTSAPMLTTRASPARTLPQCIAHRGFRARLPENSLAAFEAALEPAEGSGDSRPAAVALETDTHLTQDKVVVLSHDKTLQRCFGRPEALAGCDWPFLATLRTTQAPHVSLARLEDLLTFLSAPGREHVWVLLDIKRDDDPDELVTRIAETILAAPGDWRERIVLGCWNAAYMRLCRDRLPGFGIAYIGLSLAYSYELLDYDCVTHFNLQQQVLVGSRGPRFIRAAHARGRRVLAWTVNKEEWMDWSICHGVDGVITDDPVKFSRIRDRWSDGGQGGGDEDSDSTIDDVAVPGIPVATTPLRTAARTGAAPPTAHPPGVWTVTGLYLRRWAKLYALVAVVRLLEQAVNGFMRIKYGWERQHIQKMLGGAAARTTKPI